MNDPCIFGAAIVGAQPMKPPAELTALWREEEATKCALVQARGVLKMAKWSLKQAKAAHLAATRPKAQSARISAIPTGDLAPYDVKARRVLWHGRVQGAFEYQFYTQLDSFRAHVPATGRIALVELE